MYDLASTVLAQKVAQVTGVGDVTVGGGSLPAVRVELQPYALMQYGIALDEVRRVDLAAPTCCGPKGGDRGRRAPLADPGQRPADEGEPSTEPLIVTYRNGAPVRLADVAKVTDGVEDRYNSRLLQQRPGGAADHQPPARRQHHRDGRRDHEPAARAARLPAGRRRAARGQRPLAGHPRHAARGASGRCSSPSRWSSSWCCCSWPTSAPR